MTNPIKIILHLLVVGLILTNCAGTPGINPVKKAERSYEQVEDDSLIVNIAPDELRKAKEALVKAKIAMENNGSEQSIEQQAAVAIQQVEIAKKKAELETAKDEVQRASDELQALLNKVAKVDQSTMEMKQSATESQDFSKRLTNFETQWTDRGLVARFESGNFEQEKAYLKSSAAAAINELATYLEAYPKRNVLIEGHTDNTGSESFNQQLSEQRANAVRDALISRNIAEARIQAVGLGEQYPRVSNETEAGRAYNRRVEIIISDMSGTIPARE